jgi:hypothetical protein
VSGFESGDLSTFAVGSDGGLTAIGPRVPVARIPEAIPITPDGRFLYAASIDANAVFAFAIGDNAQLNSLGLFPTCAEVHIPAACGAVSAVISPDARNLYVANTFKEINTNDVLSFTINSDGTLSQIGVIRREETVPCSKHWRYVPIRVRRQLSQLLEVLLTNPLPLMPRDRLILMVKSSAMTGISATVILHQMAVRTQSITIGSLDAIVLQ